MESEEVKKKTGFVSMDGDGEGDGRLTATTGHACTVFAIMWGAVGKSKITYDTCAVLQSFFPWIVIYLLLWLISQYFDD